MSNRAETAVQHNPPNLCGMGARRSVLLERLIVERVGTSQHGVLTELRRAILDGGGPAGHTDPAGRGRRVVRGQPDSGPGGAEDPVGEGLVAHRRNGGYTVALLTAQELREMYIVRETLEAASLAAAVHNATDTDRAAAVIANQRLEQAIRDDDAVDYHRGRAGSSTPR